MTHTLDLSFTQTTAGHIPAGRLGMFDEASRGVVRMGSSGQPKAQQVFWADGEVFKIEREPDGVYLVHPRWSLMGFGTHLDAARQSLAEASRAVVEVYGEMPAGALSVDAAAMLAFARRQLR